MQPSRAAPDGVCPPGESAAPSTFPTARIGAGCRESLNPQFFMAVGNVDPLTQMQPLLGTFCPRSEMAQASAGKSASFGGRKDMISSSFDEARRRRRCVKPVPLSASDTSPNSGLLGCPPAALPHTGPPQPNLARAAGSGGQAAPHQRSVSPRPNNACAAAAQRFSGPSGAPRGATVFQSCVDAC